MICACTPARTVVKTEYIRVTPPESYIQTYDIPALAGRKNRDLLIWALDMREMLQIHNEDKRALQKWAVEVKE